MLYRSGRPDDWTSNTLLLFKIQGLNVVQNDFGLQKGERVDFTNDAGSINQEHLEHVMYGAPRCAVGSLLDADVLTKVIEHRKQVPHRSRRQDVPLHRRLSRYHFVIPPDGFGCIRGWIQTDAQEPDALRKAGVLEHPIADVRERAIGERATERVGAVGVKKVSNVILPFVTADNRIGRPDGSRSVASTIGWILCNV